jgi:radical SAM protein with 4Fe4S-binding SPASM domain
MRKVTVPREKVRLFNMIAIETAALCNRHCVFCPNNGTARPDELMPMELIEHIVAQLVDLKYKGCITLYNYNEPFRDKRILDITRYISERLPSACISLSSNGDYFKRPEQIAAAFDAGIRQITINIYSAADGSKNERAVQAGIRKATERADLIDSWLDELGIDKRGSLYTHAPKGTRRARVERKFGLVEDSNKIGQFELQNRAGNIEWFRDQTTEPLKKMCVRPFRFMVVNYDGKVTVCCNDYHRDVPMGDVRAESLEEIWNNERFNAYRVALLAKDRDIAMCRGCDYSGGSYPHMVEQVTFGSKAKDKVAIEGIRKL